MTAAFVYDRFKTWLHPFLVPLWRRFWGLLCSRESCAREPSSKTTSTKTIASGINIAGSGVIFTLPVLLLMKEEFSILPMVLAGIAGSIMGVTVIIPLRKQMIDLERLRFPSGTAVAAILKSPGAGIEKAILLGTGFLLSMITVILIKEEASSFGNPHWRLDEPPEVHPDSHCPFAYEPGSGAPGWQGRSAVCIWRRPGFLVYGSGGSQQQLDDRQHGLW